MHEQSDINDELVMRLVESALARPRGQRAEFIVSRCGADTDLYREVRERVEWEERMGGFLLEAVIPRAKPVVNGGSERLRVWLPLAALVCLAMAAAICRNQ